MIIPLRSGRRGWAALGLLLLGAAALVVWRSRPRPDPTTILERALAESRAGRPAVAEAALDRLARWRAPTSTDRMVRAEVAEAMGRDGEALGELAAVPEGDPAGPMARLRAGRIEVRRGRLRAAEGLFLAALAGAPDAAEPRRELAYLYALQHRLADLDAQLGAISDRGRLDEKMLVFWSRVHSGIWDAARDMEALERAVAADPDDRRSRLVLAEAHLRANRPDAAEQALAPLPESDADARALRVGIALARGDGAKAESLLSGGPDDHPALARLRGTQALARRDFSGAARHFRSALAADRNDRETLFGLGTALRLLGETAEAEPLLQAARRHDHLGTLVEKIVNKAALDDPTIRRRLGEACAGAGRVGEARAWFRAAIARDPFDEASQRALYRLDHPG